MQEVSVHWQTVCHPSLTISISIHVPYGLRTHLVPIVLSLSLSLSLRMSARSHRKISEYYGGSLSLSLHNSATNDEEKKVCQITWTFKLQNIVWYLSYGKLNTHLHFSWSNNGSFEMINFLYGTTCLLVKILCMRKKNSFFLYNPLEKIRG
jgi:hypothetical protein